MSGTNKSWSDFMKKQLETNSKLLESYNKYFPEVKVKYYKIKKLCNILFRTHFTLFVPDYPAKTIKILGVTKPTIEVFKSKK